MLLADKTEKFRITSKELVGSKGTILNSFNEVIYCDQTPNYSESFGFQWNKFQTTQLDRFQSGQKQSHDRFFAVTKWNEEDLTHQNVLEVGSGAGRFSSIVLNNTNANLVSVDYSHAVEANFRNNGPHPRLRLFQASIYDLPFEPAQFDKVFCFGVLQHTPDVKHSVECLTQMVKPGGTLIVDFYQIKGWYTKIHAKYLLRPITRKWDHTKLLNTIESNADRLIRLYRGLNRIGLGFLTRFLPVCDINRTLPKNLSPEQLHEWVVLDTFDMFSPAFDQPQQLEEVVKWFKEFGLVNVSGQMVTYDGVNQVAVVKGTR
ncbi:MAG: methyltransferase domain-containing protein [Cyclobacteriaceae bacterium]|nr:methyltransferase domain-containing protein [Cyclobacteriaceae bacterium]